MAEIVGTILGILIAAIHISLAGGWMLMLLIGNLHASLLPGIPAIGYWDSLSIVWPLAGLVAYLAERSAN